MALTKLKPKTVQEHAAEMAAYASGFLAKLPEKERDARLRAFMDETAKLSATPPADGSPATKEEES